MPESTVDPLRNVLVKQSTFLFGCDDMTVTIFDPTDGSG